jgi:putative inorganic carbon (HCO3(-)) transporter
LLILLFVFTPIAFGSIELWAFSLMELGILLIIILWSIQSFLLRTPHSEIRIPHSKISMVLLSLFLLLVLFQMLPLPSGLLKILSPKTFELRNSLSVFDSQLLTFNSKFQISLVPFVTQIEFFKWLTLSGFFLFLLYWRQSNKEVIHHLIPVLMLVGIGESLYGTFEFFSGHKYILHLNMEAMISSVTGTFINRNTFAGYLLMVIPLSVGFLFSREVIQEGRLRGWRHQLVTLDGKTLLIGFSVIVMILGLLFSASRMGIASLLLSFTLIIFLFRSPQKEKRFSRSLILILGLAILWSAWIGLDAVISRFFTSSEDFKMRWRIWVDTFQMIKDFPLFGSGLGTFLQVFPIYRSFHIRGLVTHSENDFLQLLSEVGILGTGLLVILFFFLFFKAFSGIRTLSYREPGRYIAIGGLVGILALMFHSIVERNIQIPANAFLYAFIWALILRISQSNKGDRDVNNPNSTRHYELN